MSIMKSDLKNTRVWLTALLLRTDVAMPAIRAHSLRTGRVRHHRHP